MYETSDEETEASTSDELNSGARIREPVRARSEIVVEPEPELEPEPPRKKSSEAPPKRKPVPSKGRKKRK